MTDEAAESRGPATTGAGPAQEAPSAYEPPTAGAPPAGDPPPPRADRTEPGTDQTTSGADHTTSGADQNPPGPGQNPPPWFGAGDGPAFSREKLVRPAQGRYVAGVCAAFGQATNTDPVLWRVLLGVLSFLSGVGILIYLVGWLLIPGEGDTASPLESVLGRGRSGVQPLSVVLLGIGTVLTFALVVNGGFRATLITVALVAGAGLLLKRGGWTGPNFRGAPSFTGGPGAFPFGSGPPRPPSASAAPSASAPVADDETPTVPFTSPPAGGYRPPFAPHGPWAGSQQHEYAPPPPPSPPRMPKPPKLPRQRSKLGRITFFAILLVIGTIALIDVAGATIPGSVYFFAALVTIALGLIVGAWVGRARGLIFLAILATLGLAASTAAERGVGDVGTNAYHPKTAAEIPDRYDFTIGKATVDLRAVDFTGAQQDTTIDMRLGQVQVLLPPNVDTTVALDLKGGQAKVLGHTWQDNAGSQTFTDVGADGAGGGTLHLTIQMEAGDVEVTR